MKTLTLIGLIALTASSSVFASSRLENLENAQGQYKVAEGSDSVCQSLKSFDLKVVGEDAVIDYEYNYSDSSGATNVGSESINDINTKKYTSVELLTAIVYFRNIFKQNKLIKQESVWALGIIPARYQDKRVILEIKDENTLIYNLPYYGTKVCELTRI